MLKVERTLDYVSQNKQLASKLDAAEHANNSGEMVSEELAKAIAFCDQLLRLNSYDELLNSTVDFLNNNGLSACALMQREEKKYCASIDGLCTPLEMDLITLLQKKERKTKLFPPVMRP